MEILVVNLMRLGDLIQAGPVLRGLRQEYPASRITLLAMDVFKEPALLLEGIDRLLLFPSLGLMACLEGGGGWPEAYRTLKNWFDEHLSPRPDLVINLTPTLMGAILAFAAKGKELRGLAVDETRGGYTRPSWASYALAVSKARHANPFNLVDLFTNGAGLTPDGGGLRIKIAAKAQMTAKAIIKNLSLPQGTALVGLLPGASQPERQWPTEQFAQAARLLRQARACHFFILGNSQEEALGQAIGAELPADEVTQCQGRTPLPVLAALLEHLDLLITNDTGPMHLAAAVGTPVLAIFLASARVLDTGPSGKGHIAMEPALSCHPCPTPCAHPRCHAVISPKAVASWALNLLEKDSLNRSAGVSTSGDLRVYYADIDPRGYQFYRPLVRRPLNSQDFWVWVHRLAWMEILDARGIERESYGVWVKDILARHYLPPLDDLGIAAGREALAEVQRLARQGEDAARQIIRLAGRGTPAPQRLQQQVEAVAGIDLQLRRLGVEFPELASIIAFFFQEQRQPADSQIIGLSQELAGGYETLYRIGTIFLKSTNCLVSEPALPGETEGREVAQEMHQGGNDTKLPSRWGWRHAGDYQ